MKFCPSCGNKLPDEARFCPNCGAKQPELVKDDQTFKQEEVTRPPVNQNEEVKEEVKKESEGEEYKRLINEEPKFKAMMKATTIQALSGLANALLIIVVIVFLTVPFITFTGVNLTDTGRAYLSAYNITGTYPFDANRFVALSAYNYSSLISKAFSPNTSLDAGIPAFTIVTLIGGILISALSILGSLLNALRKGYRLKEYKKDQGVTMYRELKTKQSWFIGVGFSAALIAISAIQNAGWKDLNYKETNYLYGFITSCSANMIVTIIVGAIVILMILGACIALHIVALKQVKQYYE